MKIKTLAVVATLVGSTTLTACTTTGGYQAGSPNAAVNGAVAGAAIGALAKSDGNRNDIGKAAAIGAAAGAATGYVLSTTPSYPYQR